MTYITIDTHKKQALLFLEYIKTLPFVTIHQNPNPTTLKAIDDIKNWSFPKKINQGKGLAQYCQPNCLFSY